MDNRQFQKAISQADPAGNPGYSQFFTQENVDHIYKSIQEEVKRLCPNRPLTTVPKDQIDQTMWEIYHKEYNHPQIMIQRIINILANEVAGQYETEDQVASLDPSIMLMDQSFGITAYDPRSIKLNERKYNNVDYNIRR